VFWIGACALTGATLVELNPTRRGADLARDIAHTDCAFVMTERCYREQVDSQTELEPHACVHTVDDAGFAATLQAFRGSTPHDTVIGCDAPFCLIFTSGTGGAPKAVIYSHARVLRNAAMLVERQHMSALDISYVPMPLFHSSGMLMGLPTSRTKVLVYVISGFCSGLAGVLYAFYTLSGYALTAVGTELDAIASVVIGTLNPEHLRENVAAALQAVAAHAPRQGEAH